MDKNLPSISRNYLLDNLKGLLIFLVVFGHSLELIKEEHIVFSVFYIFIYLFHMPAFVFISGYFSKNVEKARQSAFTTFLVPFVIFNTLWNLLAVLFTRDPSAFSFITPGWALWYLLSMFIWRIMLKDLVRVKYILPLSLVVGLCAGIFGEFDSQLSMSRTLVFFPFFLTGYFMKEERLFSLKKPHRVYAIFIISLSLAFSYGIAYTRIFPIEFLYGSDSFQTSTVPIWLGVLSRCLLYIIGFSFIFGLINTTKTRPTFFAKIGGNTLPVYILHTYLLVVIFVITYFIPLLWLKLMVCFVGSIAITYSLSRNHVNDYFKRFLTKLLSLILLKD
ncbi:MAG: acyltransferase family protein [Cellulosilyticaceae bacterium]